MSAICVQRFDDSLNSAIRITYRISLRSSSLREPRYPLLRIVQHFVYQSEPSERQSNQRFSTNKSYKGLKVNRNREELSPDYCKQQPLSSPPEQTTGAHWVYTLDTC